MNKKTKIKNHKIFFNELKIILCHNYDNHIIF